jgi:hypothetical protein
MVDIVMAPFASSLASKLNSWVKTDDSFTKFGKIVICLACNKSIECSMKSRLVQHVQNALHTMKKQLVLKRSALKIDAPTFDLKKQVLQGYVQFDGVREHPLV